ncbi:MAG: redox-regulated ATPase YchF [Planctomycetota bacterium]|jgi:ribosome-binding ATPase YchF (GTP1/OBG family)
MECGLVGLPGVGKTTLFSALTEGAVPITPGSVHPNVGIVSVPDPRLGVIAEHIPPEKIIHSTIRLVDIPGVASGDASRLNAILSNIRQVDAILHVVRCADFGGLGPPKPATDIEELDTELALADLVVAEGAIDKASRTARSGDKESKDRLALLERLHAVLEDGRSIRSMDDLTDADMRLLKSYGMMSAKPVLYVANVGEDDVAGNSAAPREVASIAEAAGGKSLGLAEPAIGPLARAARDLLGLSCFYTAGEKEVRAWTTPIGATAPEAAGAIHSDIQRGFIRAECYSVDDLVHFKSEKAIKDAGKMRSEGKGYQMQDGDVVHFLFNV